MGQLDLKVSESRRTMINKLLTTRMTDRLKDEETNCKKVRGRNRRNKLLTNNIDTTLQPHSNHLLTTNHPLSNKLEIPSNYLATIYQPYSNHLLTT